MITIQFIYDEEIDGFGNISFCVDSEHEAEELFREWKKENGYRIGRYQKGIVWDESDAEEYGVSYRDSSSEDKIKRVLTKEKNDLDKIIEKLNSEIEDDQRYMEEEYEAVRDYCEKKNFELTDDEVSTIRSLGMESWIETWRWRWLDHKLDLVNANCWGIEDVVAAIKKADLDATAENVARILAPDFVEAFKERIEMLGHEMLASRVEMLRTR